MNNNKFFSALLGVLCLSGFFNIANVNARSFDDIIESGEIIIAVYKDYAPFSYQEDGVAKGTDVDLAKQIAKELGVSLKLRWMTAGEKTDDDLRVNLWKRSKLHPILSDLMLRVPYDSNYSQQRNDIGELAHAQVHMFAPYHTEAWKILYNSKKIEEVSTIAVFQYHDIGVEVDSIPQFYLLSAFRGSMRNHAKQFASIALAADAMAKNKVDAVMGLRSQMAYFHHKLASEKYQLASNGFPSMGRQQWDIGMAVKADYRQLAYAVSDIVANLIKQQQMQAIFDKNHAYYQLPEFYQSQE